MRLRTADRASVPLLVAILACGTLATPVHARSWKGLAGDGIHDPGDLGLAVLQPPTEALRLLPPTAVGDQVDWVGGLRDGYIRPRSRLLAGARDDVLNLDVLLTATYSMAHVRFPHRVHTEWLACSNCHEALFSSKKRGGPMTMVDMLAGRGCGKCHGAVAFPLSECARCHSVPH